MGAEFDRLVREKLGPRPSKSAGVLASLQWDKQYRLLFVRPQIRPGTPATDWLADAEAKAPKPKAKSKTAKRAPRKAKAA